MATVPQRQSSVTLLHKGHGPSLFQFKSRPLPVTSVEKTLRPVASSPSSSARVPRRVAPIRSASGPVKPTPRIIVKCADRQDANYMFSKRIQERAARNHPPATPKTGGVTRSKSAHEQQCEYFVKERLFSNAAYKPAAFPPPSFMPRWNPRHKDRTYLSKTVLEDPWSLPPEKRHELTRRTGLRLKSLSRHYQYKVGSHLSFDKDATSKCNCYVNFCEHCSKTTPDYRCPLHMQLLDDWEPDCKTETTEFCPFSKNPEDLPLDLIQDPGLYVSEVVRRLKAGELSEPPRFPSRFLHEMTTDGKRESRKNLPASAEASAEALDHSDKKYTENSCTQTEPFMVDIDSKAAYKENTCQTHEPGKEEPFLLSSMLGQKGLSHFSIWPTKSKEESSQVNPCLIQNFNESSLPVVKKLARQTLQQALREVTDETRLLQIQRITAHYTQQLVDLQRKQQFAFLQEKWRTNAYQDEQFVVEKEIAYEYGGEESLCAIAFCQSFLYNFPGKVVDTLRRQGFVVNEDLQAMDTEVRGELKTLIEEKLRLRDNSIRLLDEMIQHAVLDLEMDAFQAKMVESKYLNPLNWTTRFIRDMIAMHEANLEMVQRIRDKLIARGWRITETGELVRNGTGTPESEGSSSDVSLDAFLKGVRVSIDSDGNPKYLVDVNGKALPINVRWKKALEDHVEKHKDTGARFDIVLDDESLSDTAVDKSMYSMAKKSVRSVRSSKRWGGSEQSKDDMGEREGEGLGLDLDFLGSDDSSEDDPEYAGRLVFKRKDDRYEDDDDNFEDNDSFS